MKIITILALSFFLALSAGCNSVANKSASKDPTSLSTQDPAEAIKAAEAALKKARGVGFEWTTTGKLIKKAKAALKKGDKKTALKLAKKAHFEGVRSYQQSETSAKNWSLMVPK